MPNDGGLIASIEAHMVDQLEALTSDETTVFRHTDHWKQQLGLAGSGYESIQKYAPAAFVSYIRSTSRRVGDFDLEQGLLFGVLIVLHDKNTGEDRIGDGTNLGYSKVRDRVIELFDRTHPGGTLTTEEFFYQQDVIIANNEKGLVAQMDFSIQQITERS